MSNPAPDSPDMDQDHWEMYATYVNEQPAMILVDIGLAPEVPIAELPHLVWAWVPFTDADEYGFPNEDVDDSLNDFEDALTETADPQQFRYVGRVTMESRREFYFYATTTTGWHDLALAAAAKCKFENVEIDEMDDPDWQQYRDVLYPSREDFQQIDNQHQIQMLELAGDPLTVPRTVEHLAVFVTESDRDVFLSAARDKGFRVENLSEGGDKEFPFATTISRLDKVDEETVDELTFELWELAEQHAGEYRGWNSEALNSDE